MTPSQLREDWKTLRAVERDLQVAVEVVVDICQRLLALAGQTPAATGADAVRRCVELGALSADAPYRKMVQFRNFVLHRYERADPDILADIVNNHLPDFERFRSEILRYVHG